MILIFYYLSFSGEKRPLPSEEHKDDEEPPEFMKKKKKKKFNKNKHVK